MRLGVVTIKRYRHTCGAEEKQATNHWGPTYSRCINCGWKVIGSSSGYWECLETEFEGRMKYAAEQGKAMADLGETY